MASTRTASASSSSPPSTVSADVALVVVVVVAPAAGRFYAAAATTAAAATLLRHEVGEERLQVLDRLDPRVVQGLVGRQPGIFRATEQSVRTSQCTA